VEGWQNADKVGILTGWFSEWEMKANRRLKPASEGVVFLVVVFNFQNAFSGQRLARPFCGLRS
jgi:hypothetical protein